MLSLTKISIIWSLLLLIPSTKVFNANAQSSKPDLLVVEKNLQRRSTEVWQAGNVDRAIELLQDLAKLYRDRGQTGEEIETRLKIATGYLNLGQFQTAKIELNRIFDLNPDDSEILASAHKKLGDAESGLGNYKQAIASYQNSLESQASLSTLNDLVRLYRDRREINLIKAQSSRRDEDARPYQALAKRYRTKAIKYARRAEAASQTVTSTSAVTALINWHELSQQLTPRQLKRGRTILESLPPSASTILLMLDWAKIDSPHQASWLYRAGSNAQQIDNRRALSYVYLELGYLYHTQGNIDKALDYTQQASVAASKSDTYESLFRAQRFMGRIYHKAGQKATATNAYQNAIASIDLAGRDLISTNTRKIVDFNREIEPIYRETIELLLDAPKDTVNLDEVLLVSDKLRLAQLRRYFGDNCFEIQRPDITNRTNSTAQNVAILNSIILTDKTVFILQLPDGRTIKSDADISQTQLQNMAQQWYAGLTTGFTWKFQQQSRQFYDLIVKPFEAELEAIEPEALVFIHDGILRNLPMAALNDGEQFLVQKWASISSLGLNYTRASPQPKALKVAAFGRSNFPPGWSELPGVVEEIQSIQNITSGQEFLDRKFTLDNLTRQLDRDEYSVVHLATHGYFGGTAETSFILAHDQKISATKLENILARSKQIPDLLVLSACETAVTSELAQLGLAGVGARSGVASTLGSLWQVEDESQSKAIEAFYSRLADSGDSDKLARPTARSALILQQIQIEQIRNLTHPQQWAALNLIGDW